MQLSYSYLRTQHHLASCLLALCLFCLRSGNSYALVYCFLYCYYTLARAYRFKRAAQNPAWILRNICRRFIQFLGLDRIGIYMYMWLQLARDHRLDIKTSVQKTNGLTVSVHDSRLNDMNLSPGWVTPFCYLGKKIFFHAHIYKGTSKHLRQPDRMLGSNLRLIS